jgi:hypothetical protein
MLDRAEAARFSRRYLGKVGRLATDWSRWVELFDVSLRILGTALVAGDKDTANEVVAALLEKAKGLVVGTTRGLRVLWGQVKMPLRNAKSLLRDWVEAQIVDVICSAAPFGPVAFKVPGVAALEVGLQLRRGLVAPAELLKRAGVLAAADLRFVDRESDVAAGTVLAGGPGTQLSSVEGDLASDGEWLRRAEGVRLFLAACRSVGDPTYSSTNAASLVLMFRPPTYVDVMMRWLRAEQPVALITSIVNAVRGTTYSVATMTMGQDVLVAGAPDPSTNTPTSRMHPRFILGNLCTENAWWTQSLTAPNCSEERQERLVRIVNQAVQAAQRAKREGRPAMLVLPELSLPRRWVREVLRHLDQQVSERGLTLSLMAGLEYDVVGPNVYNEVIAYLPRSFRSAAVAFWTKGRPAILEKSELTKLGFAFQSRRGSQRSMVLSCELGNIVPLVCSELLEVDTRARLLGRVDVVIVPAWNKDTTSFEYFLYSAALELHSFIAVANNGVFSDCRARGPYVQTWQREVCRLNARGENEIVVADFPVDKLREYRRDPEAYEASRLEWIAIAKQTAKETGKPPGPCPFPEWKPVPPGMS